MPHHRGEIDRGWRIGEAEGAVERAALTRFAAASSAFDGTQPKLRQSPPISPRSISTVFTPSCDGAGGDAQAAGAGADDADVGGDALGHGARSRRSFL